MRMARSDVLFVFPPAPGNIGAFKNHLGVAYLRAALARDGMATEQYLNTNPGTIDSVAGDIIRRKCPIVGFTVYDSNARLCIALAQSIKRRKPETQIVFGGPTPTFNARPLMERNSVIDTCVMGEAEETAARIFAKLLDGGALNDTQPGVAFRRDGQVVCAALPPLVGSGEPGRQALDTIPSPYLSGILADGREGVLTGRGCTHHCQYCCCAALSRNSLRLHSIERVVAELEYIAEHQKHTGEHYAIAILDDAFTLVPPRAKALCQAIADRKLDLVLSCNTRADTVDEELISLMREAGFGSIAFGLESAVPSVLRATGKVRPPDWRDLDLTPERQFVEGVRNSVLMAKKHGLIVSVSIILGLPTETPTDGAETLRFVKTLHVDSYAHNFLWVFPGTPLWTTHGKYRINCAIDTTGLPTTTTEPAYDLKALKPGPRCDLEQEAHLVRLLATDMLYGCEASSASGRGIGSVIVGVGELSAEMAEWLRGILRVGGIVVQVYPAMKRNGQRLTLYQDRSVLREHLVPAQRYIQVQPKKSKKKGDETWEILGAGVDVYHTHRPGLLAIRTSGGATPLIAWTKGQEAKATVCEICEYLQQPDELVQLMDRIEQEETSSPLQRMPIPPQVKYPGRWLRGKAPCSSLTRIEVSARGEVRCCHQADPIGKVGDSLAALSQRLAHLARAVQQRRGCAECGNTHCPKCPFPGIDDRVYCQIMTKQERAQRLLNWMRLYSRLPLLMAFQRTG
jgi:anaerobic magnesium-protoporphyrin IX monomethyl ester cyclase